VEINATLLVQTVLFLILLIWLSQILIAPLLKLFTLREQRIEQSQQEAFALEQEAAQSTQEFEKLLQDGQTQAKQVFAALREQGLFEQEELIKKAQLEAQVKLKHAKTEVQAMQKKVLAELEQEIPHLSHAVIQQVSQ